MVNYNVPYKMVDNINIGKILYILGTGSYGPINEPVYVEDSTSTLKVFGEGSLSKSADMFFQSGGAGAYLVRITGTYAARDIVGYSYDLIANPVTIEGNKIIKERHDLRNKLSVGDRVKLINVEKTDLVTITSIQYKVTKVNGINRTCTEITFSETLANTYTIAQLYKEINTAMVLRAMNGGVIGNDIRLVYTADSLMITWLDDIGTDGIFKFVDYPTVSDMVNAINKYIPHKVIATSIIDEFQTNELSMYNNDCSLTGGFDGVVAPDSYGSKFKNYLYDSLLDSLEILQGKYIDLICIADMYFDDIIPIAYDYTYAYGDANYVDERDYLDVIEPDGTPTGFHKAMILFCKQQADLGIMTHCIMGFNQLPDNVDNIDVTVLADYETIFKYRDGIQNELGVDNGIYLSLCFGDLKYLVGTDNEFKENWAITYAALWLNAGYNKSLTSTQLPSTVTPVQEFPVVTLKKLCNIGVVTYKYSSYYKWCVTAGITTALENNALKYTINHKILQRVISQLNIDLYNYMDIVENSDITNKSIGDVVEASLARRKTGDGILYDYGYNVSYDKISGNTMINIDIYSVWSTEKITISTNISNSR